ncbi:VOC family protein [Amylibacter sp. SFDW26]|uniref:VOC family protein n=1 Tax=Amylibacter sp. SFDW26 TaxID=2652722 RepID=UPI001D01BE4C|nr:hypothetical protein [Amylibacter sp. SFDW26]
MQGMLKTNVPMNWRVLVWNRLNLNQWTDMKFNHIGIPTTDDFDGEIVLKHLGMTVSDHKNNPFGIQWQRYHDNAPYPDLVKTVPHVAFEVDNLAEALKGMTVIIEPNSPIDGLLVAFIEVNGAPVELMEIDRAICKEDI